MSGHCNHCFKVRGQPQSCVLRSCFHYMLVIWGSFPALVCELLQDGMCLPHAYSPSQSRLCLARQPLLVAIGFLDEQVLPAQLEAKTLRGIISLSLLKCPDEGGSCIISICLLNGHRKGNQSHFRHAGSLVECCWGRDSHVASPRQGRAAC